MSSLLPTELWQEIISHLDIKSLKSLGECSHLLRVLYQERLGHTAYFTRFSCPLPAFWEDGALTGRGFEDFHWLELLDGLADRRRSCWALQTLRPDVPVHSWAFPVGHEHVRELIRTFSSVNVVMKVLAEDREGAAERRAKGIEPASAQALGNGLSVDHDAVARRLEQIEEMSLTAPAAFALVAFNLPRLEVLCLDAVVFTTPVFQALLGACCDASEADRKGLQIPSLHTLRVEQDDWPNPPAIMEFSLLNLILFPNLEDFRTELLLNMTDPIVTNPPSEGPPRSLARFSALLPTTLTMDILPKILRWFPATDAKHRPISDSDGWPVTLNPRQLLYGKATPTLHGYPTDCALGLAHAVRVGVPNCTRKPFAVHLEPRVPSPGPDNIADNSAVLAGQTTDFGRFFAHEPVCKLVLEVGRLAWPSVRAVWTWLPPSVAELHLRTHSPPRMALRNMLSRIQPGFWPAPVGTGHKQLRLITLAAPWATGEIGPGARPREPFVAAAYALAQEARRTLSAGGAARPCPLLRFFRTDPFAYARTWEEHQPWAEEERAKVGHGLANRAAGWPYSSGRTRSNRTLHLVLADTNGSAAVLVCVSLTGTCPRNCRCKTLSPAELGGGRVSWADGVQEGRLKADIRSWAEREFGK